MSPGPYDRRPTRRSDTAPRSRTAPTAPARGRCSRAPASPTRTWRSRSSASPRTWIETMPCNLNQRELAQDVKRGIREAGGTPMEFNTIAISDGVSMGTEGMRASLVSREVIADSIELVARGHLFDGLVCLVACDKTNPGRGDGARPARHPRSRPLHGLDRARGVPRQGRDGRRRVRGDRRPRGRHDDAPRSCTSSNRSPAPAPAPAAVSSPPTRCRRSWSSSGSARPG